MIIIDYQDSSYTLKEVGKENVERIGSFQTFLDYFHRYVSSLETEKLTVFLNPSCNHLEKIVKGIGKNFFGERFSLVNRSLK